MDRWGVYECHAAGWLEVQAEIPEAGGIVRVFEFPQVAEIINAQHVTYIAHIGVGFRNALGFPADKLSRDELDQGGGFNAAHIVGRLCKAGAFAFKLFVLYQHAFGLRVGDADIVFVQVEEVFNDFQPFFVV